MIYREYLWIRRTFAWFMPALLGIIVIGLIGNMIQMTPSEFDYASIGVDASWIAAIFASICGVALGNNSREPAPLLWVLPAPRWKLAIQIISVDLAATTVAFTCVYVGELACLMLADPHVRLGAVPVASIVTSLAMTYAAYGWSAIAGMLGRRTAYFGIISLPTLMIWMILAQSNNTLGAILRAPIVANPFAVFNADLALRTAADHRVTLDAPAMSLQWLSTIWGTPVLLAIAVATCGLAVILWQRAQVICA
jgi:hypothetical protein